MKQPFALILVSLINLTTQLTQWWKTLHTSRSCVYRQLFGIVLFFTLEVTIKVTKMFYRLKNYLHSQ